MKKVAVFMADGLEECEGLIVVDILRRAGVEVSMVSVSEKKTVVSSHKIEFQADRLLSETDFEDFDMVVLPGGLGGTKNLSDSAAVATIATDFSKREDKQVAAICAAPSVLGKLGILNGKKATCYPGFEAQLEGAVATGEPVAEDGNVVTGKGLGAAIPFALTLVKRLVGEDKAEEIRKQIQYPFAV